MRFASNSSRTIRFALVAGSLYWSGNALAQEAGAAGASVGASSASAYPECTTKPTEGDTAAAKGAFQAGTAAYNEADYPRAINYWEDAFRRDCTATALLLNLARAYESSNQFEKAIVALRTFNERNADSPQHDQIERRIERLEEQLKAQQSQPVVPTSDATPTKDPQQPASPQPPAENKASTEPNKWPLVIAITGGVVALIGTAGYLKGSSDVKKYESQCPNTICPNDDIKNDANAAQKQRDGSAVLAGAGVVIGIGGGIWYILEVGRANRAKREQEGAALHFMPLVSPEFAGLSFDGRF
ncbi:MAG TPA: tetratricopeptide repeat protein [Polyangiaceae bacterium]|nr:tetratricopeptide repeat protein [Polyangiaceae bacterium]